MPELIPYFYNIRGHSEAEELMKSGLSVLGHLWGGELPAALSPRLAPFPPWTCMCESLPISHRPPHPTSGGLQTLGLLRSWAILPTAQPCCPGRSYKHQPPNARDSHRRPCLDELLATGLSPSRRKEESAPSICPWVPRLKQELGTMGRNPAWALVCHWPNHIPTGCGQAPWNSGK